MSVRRLWPCIFLGLVLIGIFHRAIFAGDVLGGHHDRFDQMLPFYALYTRAFHARQVPQWNPYIFCGKTTMGSGMFVFFYPLYWLAFAGPEADLAARTTCIVIAHVAIAFCGSFLFFRRLGGDRFWATVATLSYVLSASMALQIATELNFATFAYLPLMLWLIAGQRRGRGWLVNLTAQAGVYALILLSGMVQLVLYGVAVSLAFAVYNAICRTQMRWRLDLRRLSASAAALGVGLLIGAVRWIPFFVAQRSEGGVHPTYEAFENTSHMTVADLIRFTMPEFFGTDAYESFFGQINHFESFGGSPGVLGAWLMALSLFTPWRRRTTFWNLLFLIILLTALGTPLTYLHYLATGRALLHYSRLAWLVPLPCAALIAAQGRRVFGTVGRSTFLSLGAFGGGSLLLAAHAYRTRLPYDAKLVLYETIRDSIALFVVVLVTIGMLAALAKRLGEPSRIFRAALLALVTLNLMVVFSAETNISNPFMVAPSSLGYPKADRDAAAVLQAPRMLRVFRPPRRSFSRSWANFTSNDRWIELGAYSSAGYDNGAPRNVVGLYTGLHPPNRIFERVVVPSTLHVAELSSTGMIVDDTGIRLLANPLPRVGVFTSYQVADASSTASSLLDPAFDPRSRLFVRERPSFESDNRHAVGSVQIVRDDINEVELRAQTDRPALLLLNDTYDSGWRALVDNAPSRIFLANYAFRAVEIPAGEHTIKWMYQQRGYAASAGISSLAALGLVAIAAYAAFEWRRDMRGKRRGYTR
jgi:hypothetical protein